MSSLNIRRFTLRLPVLIAALAIVHVSVQSVHAQSQSLFGNRGPASQIGSNLRGSMVGQGTTFGANSGNGLTGQPISGIGATSALGGTQQGAGTGFVGRGDAGTFIGNNQRIGQQTNRGNTGPAFSNREGRQTQRNANNFQNGQQGNNRTTQRVIRPRQRVAFDFPRPQEQTVASNLNSRFQQISVSQKPSLQVTVTVNAEGTAILTGAVDSAESARLAELMARLEPGVRNVQNELTVTGDAAEPE